MDTKIKEAQIMLAPLFKLIRYEINLQKVYFFRVKNSKASFP